MLQNKIVSQGFFRIVKKRINGHIVELYKLQKRIECAEITDVCIMAANETKVGNFKKADEVFSTLGNVHDIMLLEWRERVKDEERDCGWFVMRRLFGEETDNNEDPWYRKSYFTDPGAWQGHGYALTTHFRRGNIIVYGNVFDEKYQAVHYGVLNDEYNVVSKMGPYHVFIHPISLINEYYGDHFYLLENNVLRNGVVSKLEELLSLVP